jgi:hypothetical protein
MNLTTIKIKPNLDGTKSFGIFLVNILSLIRLMHWYTDNLHIHKILDKLYNDLSDDFDSLQEEIIGVIKEQYSCFNVSTPCIDLNSCVLYNSSPEEYLNEIYSMIDLITNVMSDLDLRTFIDSNKSGLNNTKESIITSCNKTKYLLGMVKL